MACKEVKESDISVVAISVLLTNRWQPKRGNHCRSVRGIADRGIGGKRGLECVFC